MTTAYTPILKLALPVTGELNGTWGDVVNNNITSMVEQAVAGLATINTWTANSHTLTTADGTTSESRCAMLVIDDDGAGNPSAAATVICPTATKSYIVRNLCGQTVTVKTSAGTGVAVPNNQAALVFCDGTNVVTGAFNGDVVGPATSTNNAIVTFDGTTGKLIKDNSGATISAGVITATGFSGPLNGTVGATTPSTVVATQVDITAQGDLRLQDTTGGQYVALQAPATIASSYTLTLPVDDGTSGQALITDGSGVLSWSTAASGDVYGPASATDNAVARYDGTTGKIIQNSAVTIADDGATVIDANSTSAGLRITQLGTGNALLVEDSANPDATPFVVAADGKVAIGSTTATENLNLVSDGRNFLQFNRASTDGNASVVSFRKARGTNAAPTIIASGDLIGDVQWSGYDGAAYIQSASIYAAIDGTPGTNDMPGRLQFFTTADGASSPTERMRIGSTGTISLGAAPGSESLRVSPVASAVNFWDFVGSTTGNFIGAYANGSDTNININLIPKGTGGLVANSTGQTVAAITTTTLGGSVSVFDSGNTAGNGGSVVFGAASGVWRFAAIKSFATNGSNNTQGDLFFLTRRVSTDANLSAAAHITAAGVISLGSAAGSESLRVTPVASAVNYFEVQGAITSGVPIFRATGSDTNVSLTILTKGTGYFNFQSGGGTQFFVGHTASAVNYLQVTGGATGASTTLSAQGTDTNIDITLTPKGSGYVVVDAAYSPNLTLTDAATITWDTSTAGGQVATFTFVSSNRTMGAPTNLKNGGFYALAVIQNAGSNTLTFNSVFKWAGGVAPTLSTAAGAKDYFVFRSDGTNLYQQGISQAVA